MEADIVRDYYDGLVENEWERLERHKIEFEINLRFMNRYVRPGDRLLDIGGGPGRYALHFAAAGCAVTLLDLSPRNIDFALNKAFEMNLPLNAVYGDARQADSLARGPFDIVFLMGPLYHLTDEEDRERAVRAALRLLKPGGTLFASFISANANMLYYLIHAPEFILLEDCADDFELFARDRAFSGMAFTRAYFIRRADVLPFMDRFPLEHLHLLGSESILGTREPEIAAQPPEVFDAWIDLAENVCEREELLSFSSHFLYIGRKREC